ncbi:MAG: hypothetical protein WCH61_05910 [bacterium]
MRLADSAGRPRDPNRGPWPECCLRTRAVGTAAAAVFHKRETGNLAFQERAAGNAARRPPYRFTGG